MKRPQHFFLRTSLLLLGGLILFFWYIGPVQSSRAADDDPALAARQEFSVSNQPAPDGAVSAASIGSPVPDGTPFPHLALYGSLNGLGWPIVSDPNNLDNSSPVNGTPVNPAEVAQYARHQLLILPPTPLTDIRPDIMTALRAANSQNKIWAYVMPATTWCPDTGGLNSYGPGAYYYNYWVTVNSGDAHCSTGNNRFLWLQNGQPAPENVNVAHRVQQPDLSYTYDVAEDLATLVYNDVYRLHKYDGIFNDVYCSSILWQETPSLKFDYARAGYGSDNTNPANRTAFDQGWLAGGLAYGAKLRQLIEADGGANFPISGNCIQGQASLYPTFNGWMRENFPYQDGGSWYSNMFNSSLGYMVEDQVYRAPQYNFLFTAAQPTATPYSAYNRKKMRFGLASASLGNGWAPFEDSSATPSPGVHYEDWWYDEYAAKVNVPQSSSDFGRAGNPADRGYLGQPLGPAYQVISTNANPELATNSGFETNTSGWLFTNYSPAVSTMTRETSGAPEGGADVHIHIDQVGLQSYYVNFASASTFSMSANQEYSVTFWAKADSNRTIDVNFDKAGVGGYALMTQPITSEWKRYQVRLKPTQSASGVSMIFNMGLATGDVWLDDIHAQLGVTSVYRRDFDHGMVVLNPSESMQVVQLEKSFKKILGTVSPEVNDGSIVNSVTLAATNPSDGIGDSLFLLNIDVTPPVAVTDLR